MHWIEFDIRLAKRDFHLATRVFERAEEQKEKNISLLLMRQAVDRTISLLREWGDGERAEQLQPLSLHIGALLIDPNH